MLLELEGDSPLYHRIYDALRTEILSGKLTPGARLPSTRSLASDLGVSRNVAILAYEQLLAEGYVLARTGSATVVAPELTDDASLAPASPTRTVLDRELCLQLSPSGKRSLQIWEGSRITWALRGLRLPYDFRLGCPSFADFPHATWCRLLGRRGRSAQVYDLDYGPPQGRAELREAIAGHLRRFRGMDVDAERIVITNGSQQALDLVTRVLVASGDTVLLEEPHYAGARNVFLAAGAKLVVASVDEDGMQVPEVVGGRAHPKLAYVTPSHQFPTGAILPLSRRLKLLAWAERTGAFVFEDDYDSEYRYEGRPLPALAALDRMERVIYAGTFSKLLFPALRLGYLVLPKSLVKPVRAAKALADAGTATLEQLTLADFIREGHFHRHLRRVRSRNGRRRAALIEALREYFGDRAEVAGANAGLHILVWLRGCALGSLSRKAATVGVRVYSVSPYYLHPPRRAGILLGHASLTEREIREGIKRLASVL